MQVPVTAFAPKAGVTIETDPKATAKAAMSSMDDEAVIGDLLNQVLTRTV